MSTTEGCLVARQPFLIAEKQKPEVSDIQL
jgi:hypothetical protein